MIDKAKLAALSRDELVALVLKEQELKESLVEFIRIQRDVYTGMEGLSDDYKQSEVYHLVARDMQDLVHKSERWSNLMEEVYLNA